MDTVSIKERILYHINNFIFNNFQMVYKKFYDTINNEGSMPIFIGFIHK